MLSNGLTLNLMDEMNIPRAASSSDITVPVSNYFITITSFSIQVQVATKELNNTSPITVWQQKKMSFITDWLRSKLADPQLREEKEVERIQKATELAELVYVDRNQPIRPPVKGWTNPSKEAYFAQKLEKAKLGSPYTYYVTSKANCYESVLDILKKGEPIREYADWREIYGSFDGIYGEDNL